MPVVSEMVLRFKQYNIQNSDHLDYGMMVYDKDMGWKLDPYWHGRHKHYDSDVTYTINLLEFVVVLIKERNRLDLLTHSLVTALRFPLV